MWRALPACACGIAPAPTGTHKANASEEMAKRKTVFRTFLLLDESVVRTNPFIEPSFDGGLNQAHPLRPVVLHLPVFPNVHVQRAKIAPAVAETDMPGQIDLRREPT